MRKNCSSGWLFLCNAVSINLSWNQQQILRANDVWHRFRDVAAKIADEVDGELLFSHHYTMNCTSVLVVILLRFLGTRAEFQAKLLLFSLSKLKKQSACGNTSGKLLIWESWLLYIIAKIGWLIWGFVCFLPTANLLKIFFKNIFHFLWERKLDWTPRSYALHLIKNT